MIFKGNHSALARHFMGNDATFAWVTYKLIEWVSYTWEKKSNSIFSQQKRRGQCNNLYQNFPRFFILFTRSRRVCRHWLHSPICIIIKKLIIPYEIQLRLIFINKNHQFLQRTMFYYLLLSYGWFQTIFLLDKLNFCSSNQTCMYL